MNLCKGYILSNLYYLATSPAGCFIKTYDNVQTSPDVNVAIGAKY